TGDPVELNDSPRANERLVTVEGIVASSEDDQRSFFRRDFGDHIVNVRRRAEQPQTAAAALPLRVEVDQDGDDFTFRVSVNVAVSDTALTADGHHRRPARERQVKLLLDGGAKPRSSQGGNEVRELRAVGKFGDGKTSRLGDFREILMNRGP